MSDQEEEREGDRESGWNRVTVSSAIPSFDPLSGVELIHSEIQGLSRKREFSNEINCKSAGRAFAVVRWCCTYVL